jgi:hypothetical protein
MPEINQHPSLGVSFHSDNFKIICSVKFGAYAEDYNVCEVALRMAYTYIIEHLRQLVLMLLDPLSFTHHTSPIDSDFSLCKSSYALYKITIQHFYNTFTFTD